MPIHPAKFLLHCFFLSMSCLAHAQDDSLPYTSLPDIRIKAYEGGKKLKDIPAAVNLLNRAVLDRFGTASIVSAINTTPGVRMEERSPGSYRFNIRGSSMRAPFGVRNVKVYFNDLPLTDPGGNTYLNQLGNYNFNSIEILKGPGSSLYGAGTGGVLLIESMNASEAAGASIEYTAGSNGLQGIYASVTTGSEKLVSRASFQHQQADGYRDHSSMKKDVHSWTGLFHLGNNKLLKASFLYGDLFYETPGALTRTEFEVDPKAARPGAGSTPGAVAAKASIRQRSFLSGVSYSMELAPHVENTSVLYGMFTDFRNPTIRNYSKNAEPHVGGRTRFRFSPNLNKVILYVELGGEWQEAFNAVNIHKNVNGQPDSLQSHDEINNRQSFIFSQAALDVHGWTLTAGASWNWMRLRFQRFAPATLGKQSRRFNNQLAPRLALMKKLGQVNMYSSVSKGFSPPTTAELLPTGSAVNLDLNAEEGINYDLGLRAVFLKKLYVDVNGFVYRLRNTIVQRRDASGGDYYINAGKTRQHGVETFISYPLFVQSHAIEKSQAWLSHTWHHFHYGAFRQLTNDFSGRQLPGEPEHALASGFDLQGKAGLLVSLNYYYGGRIPLNDGNTEYAAAYHLIGLKIGYQRLIQNKWKVRVAAGADNLLDQRYSLGNDINAFGGRYYNAAPGRNYYVTILVQWMAKKLFQ